MIAQNEVVLVVLITLKEKTQAIQNFFIDFLSECQVSNPNFLFAQINNQKYSAFNCENQD